MATTKTIHKSFAGGEVSPQMFGRIDDTKFQAGLETCLNFICLPQGPIERRPGFAFVREVKDSSKKVRLIPFVFNNAQTMVIELGDKYARFHTEGKTLLGSNGSPYEISTPWEEADLFDLHYVQSADVMTIVHPRYAPRELKRYSMVDWRVETINFGSKLATPNNVKATRKTSAAEDQNAEKYTFKYKVSALNADKSEESRPSGEVSVVANLYAYGTTAEISCDVVQGASFYRFYKNQGGVYGFLGDSETPSIIDDNIAPNMDITPRYYDDVFSTESGIQSVTLTNGGLGYGSVKELVSVDTSNVKATVYFWQDGRIQSFTRQGSVPLGPLAFRAVGDYPVVGSTGSGARVRATWREVKIDGVMHWHLTGIELLSKGSGYGSDARVVIDARNDKGAGIVIEADIDKRDVEPIAYITDPTGLGAQIEPIVRNGAITQIRLVSPGYGYSSPTVVIASNGSGGSGAAATAKAGKAGNYPTAVGYFEQRRCFAGLANDPQRVIMTRSSTESDLSYSLPVQDDDRISAQIASREFNQIRHIVPLSQLLLLTSGSELRVSPVNSDAITPSSFSVRPQSYVGASNVQPCLVNTTVVYPAARGGHVLELGYNYNAGGYISGDLCLRSSHLFDFKTISDMTFAKSPTPILWFVSSDGSLLGLTYIPEQQIGSWHRHTTDGAFESVTAVSEGNEDHLYAVIKRLVNGRAVRYIERMTDRAFATVESAFFVDSGGTYNGKPVTSINGLTWLEGKTVHILADGAVCPPQRVINGKISLPAEASVVHVGLPYNSDAKTLPAIVQSNDFGQGRQKNVSKVTVRTYRSSGIFAGPEFDDLVEYKQRTTEQPGTPPELVSGDVQLSVYPRWSDSGSVCVRQSDPLPLTILSAVLDICV